MIKIPSKKILGWFIAVGLVLVVIGAWNVMFEIKVQPSRRFLMAIGEIQPTPTPIQVEDLEAKVIPEDGYVVNLKWGDVGKKLVSAGGIDMAKFSKNYEKGYDEELKFLTEKKDGGIKVDARSAYFWVNTLWALGLTQKSDVLEKGVMGTQYKKELGNFASTAGWTLGAKKATDLYSSKMIIDLDSKEQERIAKIAAGIYRPCCGNSAAFPDCNHGMAILGLVELMVDQGFADEEIYKAALAFNSYWFAQTYVDLAYYFQTKENVSWDKVDPKVVLGNQYSSSTGYKAITQEIEGAPTLKRGGSSCGT